MEDDRLLHVGAGALRMNVLTASPTTMGFEIVTSISSGQCNAGEVKPSTLVEPDLLGYFIGDLDNRAHIDYLEGHYDDEPDIVAGGKRFWERCKKLRAIHPNLWG